mmetsp:Transcript_73178/g.219770  ORF Transcript_73178/g.219770 Transcript_73178/m.219770 type:complete len:203 (-) Transcript_73178:529-1137(-)
MSTPSWRAIALAVDVFASNQQTLIGQQRRDLWLEGKPIGSLRLSMPPFNRPQAGVMLPEKSELYEVPVFGLRISSAIMKAFDMAGVRELAAELRVAIPTSVCSRCAPSSARRASAPTAARAPTRRPSHASSALSTVSRRYGPRTSTVQRGGRRGWGSTSSLAGWSGSTLTTCFPTLASPKRLPARSRRRRLTTRRTTARSRR